MRISHILCIVSTLLVCSILINIGQNTGYLAHVYYHDAEGNQVADNG